jgi:SpoVK/Ycf46/Vps4 family AAA+-type ATPase
MAFTKILAIFALTVAGQSWAFVPSSVRRAPLVVQQAGGFEWEDPTESFDQGVENPFKNPELLNSEDGLKIDPFRLLGPRLNGVNLYLVGMMGSGKTAVGDIVARRK